MYLFQRYIIDDDSSEDDFVNDNNKQQQQTTSLTTMESSGYEVLTRPDTRQSSCGQLGRSSNTKTARNSKMLPTDRRTDGPTRQGVESRGRD